MLLWFAALSIAGTFLVFQDAALDYRLVALGAILPDVLDAIVRRGVGPFHSLGVTVAILLGVMLATIGRRLLRRRALALPIGMFAHLVLDATWGRTDVFWWPFTGRSVHGPVPSLGRPVALVLVEEAAGAAVALWLWKRFGLHDDRRRRKFWSSGRLDRRIV